MRAQRRALSICAASVIGAAACAGGTTGASSVRTPARLPAGVVSSNLTRADYAGSAACEPCHSEIYDTWTRAPMHNMTRMPATMQVGAPFDGRTFRFKNDTATLSTVDGDRYFDVRSSKYGDSIWRVTKIIGGHYREDFAGLRVDAATKTARILGDSHDEEVLPVSFVLGTASLRYKGYSVMTPERDGLKAGPVWNRTCIFCHNTAPYLSSMLGALAGAAAKPYQGEVVDPLLPANERASFVVTDDDGMKRALEAELSYLHKMPEKFGSKSVQYATLSTLEATRSDFWAGDLLEIGIGCESCHGGANEHVHDPKIKPSFVPHAPFVSTAGVRSDAESLTRTCGRCHQVLFSGYPWTWEGGRRNDDDRGGSHINSGEARDFLLGHCAAQLTCVDCHDPHAPGNEKRIRELEDTPAGNAVCQRCHSRYTSDAQVRAHTHHEPRGEGGKCMGCHMPRKNMSLGGGTTRYHRIASPTDAEKVERDRPLECALCHADKTVRQLLGDMKRLWGKSYDETRVAALYGGNLDQNAIVATIETGKPHEKAPAMFVAGQKKLRAAVDGEAQEMTDGYPIVRGYAARALESTFGEAVPVDPLAADDASIDAVVRAYLAAHRK